MLERRPALPFGGLRNSKHPKFAICFRKTFQFLNMLRLGSKSSSLTHHQRNRAPLRLARAPLVSRTPPIEPPRLSMSVTCEVLPTSSVFNQQAVSNYQAAPDGKLISSTEVPSFIQRDDLIDQLYRRDMMSEKARVDLTIARHMRAMAS